MQIVELYSDGGVISSNPSQIGGTFAYRLIWEDGQTQGGSGILTPRQVGGGSVTNNQTEMLALLRGMERIPNDDWIGTIYSDSQITLGRIFLGWKWKNIPAWMVRLYQEQRDRLVNFSKIRHVLVAGHPTVDQLKVGIGKHGYPVSIHNVWCDKECGRVGREYLESNVIQ